MKPWVVNLLLIGVLIAGGLWYHAKSSQAERALCALRQNLEQRVKDSQQYQKDVREGKREPIPGITDTDIETGIRNQQQTIDALSSLDCMEAP